MEREQRVLTYTGELRASKSGKGMRVTGFAARYNVLSNPLPMGNSGRTFRERIAKRAFDGILATKPDVVCTHNHDMNQVLGRTTAGTLRLRGTDEGLQFDCDLPDTQAGHDCYEQVRVGNLQNCSFAFDLGERDQSWTDEEEEIEDEMDLRGKAKKAVRKIAVRTIKSFRKLFDVSIVAAPAYPGTSVDARNLVTAQALEFGRKLGAGVPGVPFELPKTSRAFNVIAEATRVYNLRHNANLTESQVMDVLDRRDMRRRQKMLADILAD